MIEIKTVDGIAVMTVAYGKANALDIALCDALAAGFNQVAHSDARALVVTGQGRMFSAGVDLPQMLAGGAPYVRKVLPALHRLYHAAFFLPKPVVAAVNGHAIAGGCVLACCADRRLMAHDAGRIGVTELLVGVPFPALAFEVMRFATVPKYFPDVILGAATYHPEPAQERGFIDEVVDPSSLMNAALEAARKMASLSPAAFAQTKQQIRQAVSERLLASGEAVDAAVTEIWAKPETLSYMRDYVARTLKK
jgi:enoyl-CoA hydratase